MEFGKESEATWVNCPPGRLATAKINLAKRVNAG